MIHPWVGATSRFAYLRRGRSGRRLLARRCGAAVSLVTAIALLLPPGLDAPQPTFAQPQTTSSGQKPCGCPQIEPVAKSDKPDPGKIMGEVSFADLEHDWSNRASAYGGDWDKALLAVAHDIDPTGEMKIWKRPAPTPTNRSVNLQEGTVSKQLIAGITPGVAKPRGGTPPVMGPLGPTAPPPAPPPAPPGAPSPTGPAPAPLPVPAPGRPSPQRGTPTAPSPPGGMPTPPGPSLPSHPSGFHVRRLGRVPRPPDQSTHASIGGLVYTLARINKYGEPVFGLRKAVLRVARFWVSDLANAPPTLDPNGNFAASRSSKADAVHDFAINAQHDLRLWLEGAVVEVQQGVQPAPPPDKNFLHVDPFDIGNAVLDILLSVDDRGKREGVIPIVESDMKEYSSDPALMARRLQFHLNGLNYERSLIPNLVLLAAARPVFGGHVAPNSPADAVACKAFTVLVQLVDYRMKIGRPFRPELHALIVDRITDPYRTSASRPRVYGVLQELRAARAALILGGFADADEARAFVGETASGLFDQADHFSKIEYDVARGRRPPDLPPGDLGPDALLVTMRTIQDFVAGPARGAFAAKVQSKLDESKKYWDYNDSNFSEWFQQHWADTKPDWDPLIAEPLCPPEGATPRIIIFANGVNGRIMIKKLYVGVPTTLGVIFPEPYSGDEYPVKIRTGGGELTLTARPLDDQRLLFETERFVINE